MTRALFSFLALGALALVIGCGGGAGRGTFIPTATPTPHVGATTVPVGAAATSVAVADGNGNTASFTIPQAVGGASANMTMTLSGSLPAGISVPAIRRAVGKPDAVGANVNALQYVSVVMDGNLGISTSPAVTFGLASPAPASAQMYLLLWDPARAGQQGWIVLLGPGTVGNPRTLVTFNGVPTGQSYAAGNTYVYALVTTSGAVPTATPAPVPTTAPRAQSTTMPAYCANFATASPAPNLGPGLPQPVIFNDNSALNGDVVFYVTDTGQDAGGRPAAAGELVSARALNAQGQWSTPNPLPAYTAGPLTLAPIQPIPLKCFPGSIGVNGVPKYSGRQFKIPVAVSGLIYIAYAPSPAPGSTAIPDPFHGKFGFVGTPGGNYGIQAPSDDWRAASSVPTPWDAIEYCLNVSGCVMDLTQENRVGLPLELAPGGNPVVGFGPGAIQQVLSDLQNTQTYDVLPAWVQWGSTTALARIMAPGSAGDYGFPQDWWYDNNNYLYQNTNPLVTSADRTNVTYYPSNYSAQGQGYIGYLLQQYHAHPQTYTIAGTTSAKTPTTNDVYCARSDGTSTFVFIEIGSAGTAAANPCAASPAPTPMPGGNVFDMSAWSFVEGNPMQSNPGPASGYCQTAIFNMAASGPGQLVEIPNAGTTGVVQRFLRVEGHDGRHRARHGASGRSASREHMEYRNGSRVQFVFQRSGLRSVGVHSA